MNNVPIRMRVVYAGNRIDFSTGYRIDVAKWDTEKQRVKNGCSNKLKQSASEINTDLLTYYADIQAIFKEFEVQNRVPTPEQLKEAFSNKYKQPQPESKSEREELSKVLFNAAFDEFIKECGAQNSWGDATYGKFAALKNHLTDFDENLSFEVLDETKLMAYLGYLRDVVDMRNNTLEKQISYLKWFLRWSVKKGYNNNIAFETFKPKLKYIQKKVIFLTWKELNRLREYVIPDTKKYLERVRDVFLFCCFTGLRYSDVYNLKRSDVKDDRIEITTIKTADSLIIELNNHSKTILDKYKGIAFENDKVLPVISNQKMNDYLKELAELAEINEPVRETYYKGNERIDVVTPKYALLGTHAGRRTFICNALSLGIPAQVVMKWTGHSDYKAMKPYVDIADDIKASAMDKFNRL
ncbi:Tyrosine recombinase XerC [termite gut metagenome]|uniref:Tyrosine recombinase XerC n=1 Tax=termite gut metagenome TaxID=433724 RepID=A0A5J4QS79_9ZZZZ